MFVLAGTFLEEVFSPIPSFLVLVPAGAVVQLKGQTWWYLLVLVLFSAVGRAAGATILYFLSDKLARLTLKNGRRVFGVTHKDLQDFGKKLSGNPLHDWIALFTMNALPFFPGAFISIIGGIVKVDFKLFITSTFFGTMVNSIFYLSIGYAGLNALQHFSGVELGLQIFGLLLAAFFVIWFIRKYKNNK